jgi:hypothetical protein
VRFLSELGKIGPYAPVRARVARRWEVATVSTPEMRISPTWAGLRSLVSDSRSTWNVVYSRVAGSVPVEELTELAPIDGGLPLAAIRCEIDVSTPGAMALTIEPEGLVAGELNGIELRSGTNQFELPVGKHAVTLLLRKSPRAGVLRCELGDVAGSRAQAQFTNGK